MKRLKLLCTAAALLLLIAPMAWAQGADGYGDFPQEIQTTNSPAGTAVEPGSQLLFLLDTGINPMELNPNADPTSTISSQFGITDSVFSNFISITNTNPTDAVTVHFRYFNNKCEDILDFLVVLTCNDTMLVNAFDYVIPNTNVNVKDRFFGTNPNAIAGIPTGAFGDGRFLLFVTASGDAGNDSGARGDTSTTGDRGDFDDPEDLDKFADWLFPNELVGANLVQDCPAVDPNTIGVDPGVNDNNLNIFNSSAISFNYLTGFHTVGAARGGGLASYGVTAWTRPAVHAAIDLDDQDTSEVPDGDDILINPQDVVDPLGVFDAADIAAITDGGFDGDGPLAPKRCLLAGTEEIWLTLSRNASLVLPANNFYLRHDAHGGRTFETNCEGVTAASFRCDGFDPFHPAPVTGGALNWTLFSVIPADGAVIPPEDQFLYMVSVKDDYNGSNNPNNGGLVAVSDNSYRLDPAATFYELTCFNNNEEELQVTVDIPPISPPPPFIPLSKTMAVKCIDAYRFEIQNVGGNAAPGNPSTDFVFTEDFGLFSVQDLFSLDGRGLLEAFFTVNGPVKVNSELGPGWIRFDRRLTRDFFFDSTMGAFRNLIAYDGERGSYVTIAKNILFLNSFGVSWYLPLSATDANLFIN